MNTYFARKEDFRQKKWCVVDAEGKVLGRLATEVANILRGKNKPFYTPHVDTGEFVVVINAAKVQLTGKKWTQKPYFHHSGYRGGLKELSAEALLEKKPEEMIRKAVKGMLPKNKLGRKTLKKLKVYASSEHPHEAQVPASPPIKEKAENQ